MSLRQVLGAYLKSQPSWTWPPNRGDLELGDAVATDLLVVHRTIINHEALLMNQLLNEPMVG